MTRPRILVSGVGRRNELLRLLNDACRPRGIDLVGCDASPLAAARGELAHFELLPLSNDPGFELAYARVLDQYKPIAYLTLIDPEITALGMLISEPPFDQALFLHPAWATSEVCEDKFAFSKHMESQGLPVVPTFLGPVSTFPQIRKDRRGSGASGFSVYRSAGSLPVDVSGAEFVYQSFQDEQSFCVDAYYSLHSGELIDCCVKLVLSRKNGESLVVKSVQRDPFLEVLRAVGNALPLRGIVNFDLVGDEDQHRILEINGRIGGNYPASQRLGVNLLDLALQEVFAATALQPALTPYEVGGYVSTYPAFTGPTARTE